MTDWTPENNRIQTMHLTPSELNEITTAKHGVLFYSAGSWHDKTGGKFFPTDVYRAKPAPVTQDVVPWEAIDARWKWAARDTNGRIYLFVDKPTLGDSSWQRVEYARVDELLAGLIPGTCDWRDSLQQRPQPAAPEAVAQMVADREAGTPGPFRNTGGENATVTDNHGIPVAYYVSADNRPRFARLPDLEAAYLTLAAENATLAAERDAWREAQDNTHQKALECVRSHADALVQIDALRQERDAAVSVADDLRLQVEVFEKAGRVLQHERDALLASEAAVRDRVKLLEEAMNKIIESDDRGYMYRQDGPYARIALAALTTNGETP